MLNTKVSSPFSAIVFWTSYTSGPILSRFPTYISPASLVLSNTSWIAPLFITKYTSPPSSSLYFAVLPTIVSIGWNSLYFLSVDEVKFEIWIVYSYVVSYPFVPDATSFGPSFTVIVAFEDTLLFIFSKLQFPYFN